MKKNMGIILLITILSLFLNIKVVKADTNNIVVDSISVKEKSGTITVLDPVLSSNEITSNITFNQIDDFVTYELKIKNNDEDKYKIESIKDNNTNTNIKIEYNYEEKYIQKGENSTVTIKISYKNKLLNVEKINLNDLVITLNLVNEQGKTTNVVINNPTTGDNILMYLLFFILSLTGLLFISKKVKVKGVKIGTIIFLLSILTLPYAIFALEKYEMKFKFTDIVVKGEFETYNISIDKGDGSSVEVRQITYGDTLGNLGNNPSKEGYTFDHYEDSDGNTITSDTVITKETEIIAKYNIIEYTIKYNLNGGTASNPSKYTIETDDITLNNPKKTGYTFSGWTGSNGETKQISVTIVKGNTGNKTYTANYSANENTEYTVTHRYQNLDGTYTEEVSVEHGETDAEVTAPLKEKTGFVSPPVQKVTIKGDESSYLTYTYDIEEYAFSITDRTYIDSTSTANGTYKYGTLIRVKAQERKGYAFKWSDNDTSYERTFNLEGITNLSPIYTEKTDTPYTVKHYKMDLDGINYTLVNTQNLTGKTDSTITPAVNIYEGFTAPTAQTTTINGAGNTLVEYYYTRNKVTVTINNPEDIVEGDLSDNYYYGDTITLTAKDKEGYTFTKWSNDETNNPLTIEIGTSDIEIGPIYTRDNYQVIYNANGGTGSMDNQSIDVGVNTKLTKNTFTKTDYEFIEWNTLPDGTGTSYLDEQDVINLTKTSITLYAIWAPEGTVAQIGDIYYETLQAAINEVPTDSTKTTVKLLKDISETINIKSGRNVYLDLRNHTVTNKGDSIIFNISSGTFEPVNGTITTTASSSSAINVNAGCTLNVGSVTIQSNGSRQAIYNNGGKTYISDGAIITGSAPERSVVHNKENGKLTITGGTIISSTLYAVYNESGTLVIGTIDGSIDTTKPVIQGETFGIVAYSSYKFYDGTIKGKTAAAGKAITNGKTPEVSIDVDESMISAIENRSEKVNGQDGDYYTLYLIPKPVQTYTYSIKVDIPDTFPTSYNSPLVPIWTLGKSYKLSKNTVSYESILLTKTSTPIDVTSLAISSDAKSSISNWFNSIGKEKYYLPAMGNTCKKVKITMDNGYEKNTERKNPKVLFLQGTSPKTLVVNGKDDGNSGITDIQNSFGERQITDTVTEIYQIENGSTIDLSPYWDNTLEYHALSIRGYGSSLSGIKGATIEYTCEVDEDNRPYYNIGTVNRTVNKSFQGALVDLENEEIFQIMDGGHTMVLDMYTLKTKREFDLPKTNGSGHFSSVEWLDQENKIFITTSGSGSTTDANKIYVYDMSDEENITITTLTSPDMSSDNYSYMGDLAYDSQNKLLYVGGYAPDDTTRSNIIITTIDMSPYIDNGETTVEAVGDTFTTAIYHMQDGGFYNGKIYYLVDSTTGRGSYNTFAVLEIDPSNKSISNVYNIELSKYHEAESIVIVPGNKPYLIISYWDGSDTEYYYKKYLNN